MISPEELSDYIRTLQSAGITGRAKIGDIELTIPPAVERKDDGDSKPQGLSQKAKYDQLLFAATEGIPEEEGA